MLASTNPRLVMIAGHTGSGKTGLLQHLSAQGFPVIDLEKLAGHKGSVFGHLGTSQTQPSQQDFEDQLETLYLQYLSSPYIFTEQEAPSIGKRKLPSWFLELMEKALVIHLDIPAETRAKKIVEDYGSIPREQLLSAIGRLSERFPEETIAQYKSLIASGDYLSFTKLILAYYDRSQHYSHHSTRATATLSFNEIDEKQMADAVLEEVRKW